MADKYYYYVVCKYCEHQIKLNEASSPTQKPTVMAKGRKVKCPYCPAPQTSYPPQLVRRGRIVDDK